MSTKMSRDKTMVEGSTVKTTYEMTTTETDSFTPKYKSLITPRTTVIQRSSYSSSGGAGGGNQMSMRSSMGGGYAPMHVPAGAYQTVTASGVTAVKSSREREKKDMQDLNERFASYIEKVRFLEAQNRKLADELDKLKAKWGKETTAIKAMYQAELEEARRLLDDAEKEKARLEIKVSSQEEEIEELRIELEQGHRQREKDRELVDNQQHQLSEYEGEINSLRRRLEQFDSERGRDKETIKKLTEQLKVTKIDLDNETLSHIDAENRRQTLEEELEFLKQVHEQQLKELAALAYRDTTAENREYWKNEMGSALREIQQTYDEKLDVMRAEMETYYNLKIQEFRTGATRQNMDTVHAKEESKKLRGTLTDLRAKLSDLEARNAQLEKELERLRRENEDQEREWESENGELKGEVARLRAEMESILKELQELIDTKLGLELEIAAYRKLLEGEENRVGLRQIVETMMTRSEGSTAYGGEDDTSIKLSQVVKGEMSAKTTYQRSAKGPISISECSADGKFVTLENTSRKDENLGGWRVIRTADDNVKADCNLSRELVIKAGHKVKLYARGTRPSNAAPGDQEVNVSSWGVGGSHIVTKLVNPAQEDRATHTQRTTYSS